MPAPPTHIVQTSTEAKKAHKKNATGLSSHRQRQLERSAELDQRAAHFREKEERRKDAKKKREEREKKEREARRQNGVGLATQLIGYSHTQAKLKQGMEAFLGYQKRADRKKEEKKAKEAAMAKEIEAAVEEVAREPWDDDDGDAFELPDLSLGTSGADQWIDDDLDDDTLLEAHDLVMSDPMEGVETPEVQMPHIPAPALASVSAPESPKRVAPKEDVEFKRRHGPINQTLEHVLAKLPDPLIELLSQDNSKDPSLWNPASALLHKLNPIGLPPHRLRIKVGCSVTLLRELNSSSQSSKSQHLQILRMEKDRLECLVLDGHLAGTKTLLTRTTFSACHHNDTRYPFQRLQYPIQVAKDYAPISLPKELPQSSFKMLSMSGRPARHPSILKKPSSNMPKPRSTLNRHPSFKLPGLPASKSKPVESTSVSLLDGWDDFLDSGTQIARELSQEQAPPVKAPQSLQPRPSTSVSRTSPPPMKAAPAQNAVPPASIPNALTSLSTQDFDFSLEDLVDSPVVESKAELNNISLPPLSKRPVVKANTPTNVSNNPTRQPTKPPQSKHTMPPPPLPRPEPRPQLQPSRAQVQIQTSPAKRKAGAALPARQPPPLRLTIEQLGPQATATPPRTSTRTSASSLVKPKTTHSFCDFGLSTQEAISFFDDDTDDDDELAFGSPIDMEIVV